MQAMGYIFDRQTNEKILILVRQAAYGRYLKKRKSGKDEQHFEDEEIFLNEPEEWERLKKLKDGEVIFC